MLEGIEIFYFYVFTKRDEIERKVLIEIVILNRLINC